MGVTGDPRVNMCLHHARNRNAVQNNALISTIIYIYIYFETSLLILPTFRDVTLQTSWGKCFFQSKLIIIIWESIYQTI